MSAEPFTGKMVPDGNGGLIEQIVFGSTSRFLNPTPKIMTIYFVGPKDGPIKIGRARRLSFRFRELELACPYPLHIWAAVEAAPSLERDYHRSFAAHRLHGEWFERHPDILAEIARLNSSDRREA